MIQPRQQLSVSQMLSPLLRLSLLLSSILWLTSCSELVGLIGQGSISISHSDSMTVSAGKNTSINVAIERSDYSGPVEAAITGLPSGVTSSANSTSNDSVVLTINTRVDMTPGTYTLNILASGDGITAASGTFSLRVNAPPDDVITAEAFWWGFHLVIPQSAMEDFTDAGSVVAAFMALGGAALAASGGAAAPFVAVAAAYVALELPLMHAVNQGKGVYLSMTWIVPGIFVPTAITD